MVLFPLGVGLMLVPALAVAGVMAWFHLHVRHKYLPILSRTFQEKPLFVIPRGKPWDGGEDVTFPASDGKALRGCYLRAARPRRGVILFGLEFGSERWSCRHYVEHLVAAGYDVFAFEPRGQGESDPVPGYEPLQWVTVYEADDARSALAYLKGRPDADPAGVGFFGISKGAGAGAVAAAEDPYVRCLVTDGMFGFETATLPHMRKYFKIYNTRFPLDTIPDWYLMHVCRVSMRQIEQARGCRFESVEAAVKGLGSRPLLMIHGEADSYIKPSSARELFARASGPRELWMVGGAKHNQALQVAEPEYRGRVLAFFDRNLADDPPASAAADSGPPSTSDAGRKEAVTSGPGV
ncbi:MAG: alpha/beta hydrolase [Gemmataceae bacterium]